MHRHITYYTQSTVCQGGSSKNISVVVHGCMQDLPRMGKYFFWEGGGLATRCVAMRLLEGFGAPAGRGGKSRPSPPPPFEKRKFFGYIVGLFATFFSFWRPFHHVGTFLLLFTSWWRPFLGLPPPPTKISAGAHDCKEGSRACSPEIFCVTAI